MQVNLNPEYEGDQSCWRCLLCRNAWVRKITKLLVCKGVARKIPTHHHNDIKKVPSRSQVGSPPQLSSAAGAGTAQEWTEWMTDISTSFQFLLLGIPKIKCGRALGTNNYSTSTNLSRSDHTSLFSSQKHGVQFYKIKSD